MCPPALGKGVSRAHGCPLTEGSPDWVGGCPHPRPCPRLSELLGSWCHHPLHPCFQTPLSALCCPPQGQPLPPPGCDRSMSQWPPSTEDLDCTRFSAFQTVWVLACPANLSSEGQVAVQRQGSGLFAPAPHRIPSPWESLSSWGGGAGPERRGGWREERTGPWGGGWESRGQGGGLSPRVPTGAGLRNRRCKGR